MISTAFILYFVIVLSLNCFGQWFWSIYELKERARVLFNRTWSSWSRLRAYYFSLLSATRERMACVRVYVICSQSYARVCVLPRPVFLSFNPSSPSPDRPCVPVTPFGVTTGFYVWVVRCRCRMRWGGGGGVVRVRLGGW